jgi:hypothetical protein
MNRLLVRTLLIMVTLAAAVPSAGAQPAGANYDESKVGSYALPDPLRLRNGKVVKSTRQWERKARPAVLALFAEHVYGRMPGKPKDLHFKVVSEDADALGGKAIRKQITVFFTRGDNAPSMDILLYLPKGAAGPRTSIYRAQLLRQPLREQRPRHYAFYPLDAQQRRLPDGQQPGFRFLAGYAFPPLAGGRTGVPGLRPGYRLLRRPGA